MRFFGLLSAAAVAAVAVAGCGGSGSSSSERTQLLSQLSGQVRASSLVSQAPDLASCMVTAAHRLATPDLRRVAAANPDPAAKHLVIGLLDTCLKQGHGLAAVHAAIVTAMTRQPVLQSLPAAFTSCVTAKVNAIPPAAISELASLYVFKGRAAEILRAQRIGAALGRRCISQPGVLTSLRAKFVAPFKRAFAATHYSAAFKDCMLAKAQRIPLADLRQFVLHPATAQKYGESLGRRWAHACVASGARP